MSTRKECVSTPVTADSLRGPLTKAWTDKFGTAPEPESISLLLAHVGLETGWHACKNWNLGNAKAVKGGPFDWTFFTTWELVLLPVAEQVKAATPDTITVIPTGDGKHAKVVVKPDHPWCCFRSFDTLEDGARVYLDTLYRTFTRCWPAVQKGDPELFAKLLKEQHYYTAPLTDYTRGMVARFDQCSLPKLTSEIELHTRLAELGYKTVLEFQRNEMPESEQDGVSGPHTRIAIRRALKALQS